MAIPKCILTRQGAALLAKTPAGARVPVTRWQLGTGALPAEENLEDRRELVRPLMYRPISSVTNSGRQSLVLGQFVNEGLDAFDWEELGLWAQDPEEGEILYAVGNARGDGEHIEAWTEKVREFVFGMELVFSGTANVTAEISRTLIFATLKDLERKADLVDGRVPREQLPEDVLFLEDGKIPAVHMPASGAWYRSFEAEQWSGGALRIPQSEHGANPTRKACMYQLRQRVDRTALDYYGASAALGRVSIVSAMREALAANEAAPSTYPAAFDGHIKLTWEQVQYYILEGILASAEEAAAKAAEKGFDWKGLDTTGTPETATLDELLAAAYVPALGGSAAQLDSLCTDLALQGLRLRRKADKAGAVERYDLEGYLSKSAWSVLEARVYWDLDTKELVVEHDAPFAGDIFVLDGGRSGSAGGGASTYVLPAATSTRLGGVKASDSLTVDPDGTAHAVAELSPESFATGAEVDAILDDVFGAQP